MLAQGLSPFLSCTESIQCLAARLVFCYDKEPCWEHLSSYREQPLLTGMPWHTGRVQMGSSGGGMEPLSPLADLSSPLPLGQWAASHVHLNVFYRWTFLCDPWLLHLWKVLIQRRSYKCGLSSQTSWLCLSVSPSASWGILRKWLPFVSSVFLFLKWR